MKKIVYFLIVIVIMTALLLIACNNTNKGDETTSADTYTAETASEETDGEATSDSETTEEEETSAEETTVMYSEVSPAEGETVALVHPRIGDWYAGYTTSESIGSTISITTKVKNNLPVAVALKWSYAGTGKFTVTYGMKSDLSDGVAVEADGSECQLLDLFVSTQYYWQISANDGTKSPIYSFVTADNPRLIDVPKLQNARDFGGHMTSFGLRIKQGIAYRTGRLDELPESSIQVLNERYGIKTELDLRYNSEVGGRTESWLGSDKNYIHIPSGQYLQFFTDSYPGSLKNEIEVFLDPENYPVLFHCSVGKDRTGSLAALLQAVCGVDEITIIRDYELSYLKNTQSFDLVGHTCEKLMYENFLPFLMQMKRTFGTDDLTLAAERMLQSIGFTPADINTLRRNLLGEEYTDREIEVWTNSTIAPLAENADPFMAWKGDEIANDLVLNSFRLGIKSSVASKDKTYTTLSSDSSEGCVYLFLGTTAVQVAPVIAFRYKTSSFERGTFVEVFTDSENVAETAGKSIQANLENDGKWHTVVIDLKSSISNYNGYSAKYFRIDLLNRATETDTIDYSFVGLFTSVDAANAYMANLK